MEGSLAVGFPLSDILVPSGCGHSFYQPGQSFTASGVATWEMLGSASCVDTRRQTSRSSAAWRLRTLALNSKLSRNRHIWAGNRHPKAYIEQWTSREKVTRLQLLSMGRAGVDWRVQKPTYLLCRYVLYERIISLALHVSA